MKFIILLYIIYHLSFPNCATTRKKKNKNKKMNVKKRGVVQKVEGVMS